MRDLGFLETIHQRLETPESWAALGLEEQRKSAAYVRDAFFVSIERKLKKAERRQLEAVLERLEPQVDVTFAGMPVSFHPTHKMRLLRYVDLSGLEPELRAWFLQPNAQTPELSAVFVDPIEFDYRTFENIIGLDRLTPKGSLSFSMEDHEAVREDIHTLHVQPDASTHELLEQLDALDLYVPPLETNARGGLRYLFHSAELSRALGEALLAALPEETLEGFSHVNPVFRCNRFSPEDGAFEAHVDAPYYDPNRGHVSRYTLILYVTGGAGEATLEVDGVAFDGLDAMTAVLFHQSLEHQGAPFDVGDKVFVRTELIFEIGEEEHVQNPDIAALFSRACYMDRQSLLHPELTGYMQRCYDRVARAHWEGLGEEEEPPKWMHRQYRGVDFVANGHDFWFREDVDLKACAALALFDYFNVTLVRRGGIAFYKECVSKAVTGEGAWIPKLLKKAGKTRGAGVASFPKEHLLRQPNSLPYHGEIYDTHTYWGDENDTRPGRFQASNRAALGDYKVSAALQEALSFCKTILDGAPILVMGQRFYMDPERFVVQGDKIYVGSEQPLEAVHFAADVSNQKLCWPGNFIEVSAVLGTPYLLIPPILWRRHEGCFHLRMDFFHNDWMVAAQGRDLPLPESRGRGSINAILEKRSMPWLRAVEEWRSGGVEDARMSSEQWRRLDDLFTAGGDGDY